MRRVGWLFLVMVALLAAGGWSGGPLRAQEEPPGGAAPTEPTPAATPAPSAPFAAKLTGPERAAVGEVINLDASGSTGDIIRYRWDFGDGSFAIAEPQTTHTFKAPGKYTVTVNAVSRDSKDAFARVVVEVTPTGGAPAPCGPRGCLPPPPEGYGLGCTLTPGGVGCLPGVSGLGNGCMSCQPAPGTVGWACLPGSPGLPGCPAPQVPRELFPPAPVPTYCIPSPVFGGC